MKSKLRKNVTLIIVIVILMAVGIVWWRISPGKTAPENQMAAVAAQKGTIEVSVSVNGTVQPSLTRNLTANAGGKIVKIDFKSGQQVKKGELLVRLDPGSLLAEVERARLDVQQAELDRNSTLAQIEQQQVYAPAGGQVAFIEVTDGQFVQKNTLLMIIDNGSNSMAVKAGVSGTLKLKISEKDTVKKGEDIAFIEIDNIDNQLASQEIRLQQARLNLETLQAKLSDYKLSAPFDGTVNLAQAGEAVAASTQNQGSWIEGDEVKTGQVLATIQSAGEMVVIAPVDEVDISKVKLGQKAEITIDALPGGEFSGTVTAIESQGQVTSGVASFDVQVVMDKTEGLRPGMTANVEIMVDRKENVLVVPIEAVQEKQGQKYVQMAGNSDGLKQVETGIYNESVIEIRSGLKEGDEVALPSVIRKDDANGFGGGGQERPF